MQTKLQLHHNHRKNNLPKEKWHSCFLKNLFTCQVESQNFELENGFDLSASTETGELV